MFFFLVTQTLLPFQLPSPSEEGSVCQLRLHHHTDGKNISVDYKKMHVFFSCCFFVYCFVHTSVNTVVWWICKRSLDGFRGAFKGF